MLVVLLFEILDDLNNLFIVMCKLFSVDWYCGYIQGKQFVMIGYLDLVKDVGVIVVGWVQYEFQEVLVVFVEEFDVILILFYGCGGIIGCGGLLVYVVIYFQFLGLLDGGFCVIE